MFEIDIVIAIAIAIVIAIAIAIAIVIAIENKFLLYSNRFYPHNSIQRKYPKDRQPDCF